MTFRIRTILRLLASLVAAVTLTCLALTALPAEAQDAGAPLFVSTGEGLYAAYPVTGNAFPLDIPGPIADISLSPDGAHLLVMSYPNGREVAPDYHLVETANLSVQILPLIREDIQTNGVPLWRWDSGGILFVAYGAEGARVFEYDLTTYQVTLRAGDVPTWGEAGMIAVPRLVWWTPDGFALLQGKLSPSAGLLPYTSEGDALPYFSIYDMDDADLPPFSEMSIIDTSDGLQLALYRHDIDRWDVVYPLSGRIEPLDAGETIVQAPRGLDDPHFVVTVQRGETRPVNKNVAVAADGGRRLLFDDAKALVTVSPDGLTFTLGDFIGFGVSDGEARTPVVFPPGSVPLLQWEVAWSPLESLILDAQGQLVRAEHTSPPDELLREASISPDGRLLVTVRHRGDSTDLADIVVLDAQTLEATVIYAQSEPSLLGVPTWRPDSRALTWSEYREGSGTRILTYDLDTKQLSTTTQAQTDRPLFVSDRQTLFVMLTSDDGLSPLYPLMDGDVISGAALSPDGRRLVVWRDPDANYYSGELWLVDTNTLAVEKFYEIRQGFLGGTPSWSADSRRLLWSEYQDGYGGRVIEYDLNSGEMAVRARSIPLPGDGSEFDVPNVVWWDGDQFGLMVYGGSSQAYRLLVYDGTGAVARDIPLSDGDSAVSSRFTKLQPLVVSGAPVLGVYYADFGQWDIVDLATGLVTPVDGSIAAAPVGVDPSLLAGYAVRPDWPYIALVGRIDIARYEPLANAPLSALALSPDGLAYAYVADGGTDVTIWRDGATVTIQIPEREDGSTGTTRLVWSATTGFELPNLQPVAQPGEFTALLGDCTARSGVRPGATAHVEAGAEYGTNYFLYGPPVRVEGGTLPAGVDFPVMRALCRPNEDWDAAIMFEVEYEGQPVWANADVLALSACADGIPTRLAPRQPGLERYGRVVPGSLALRADADPSAEAVGVAEAGRRLRLIQARCGADGRLWWWAEAPGPVYGFAPETIGGEPALE